MNKLNLTLTTLFLAIVLAVPAQAYKKKAAPVPEAAAPAAAEQAAAPQMDEAMMAKFKEYSTPNEHHAVLNYFVGNWAYNMKWWMDPSAPPEESNGQSEAEWAMGGRFLEQEVSGTSMGQPFQGMSLWGYDNVKKQYQTLWIDNMATGFMTSLAVYDPTTKTFTETGSHSCPLTESGEKIFRSVTTIKDDDHYTYEFYTNTPDGTEFKAMEISYSRVK